MADYNINAVTRRKVFSGSAGTGPYSFTFEVLDQNDLAVYKNATKLTLTVDYTVTVNANGTGDVNLVLAATSSDTVTIIGARDIERTTDFVTAGDLRASALNEQLDALTIFDQQIAEENKRQIIAPVEDPEHVDDGGTLDMTLPAKDTRKGKYLAFNSTTGNPEAGASSDDVTTLAAITSDIATLADIQDGTTATDAISKAAAIDSDISLVAAIDGDVTKVANVDSDVTTVAGQISPTNNISTVAGKATEIGRLGTADAVSDMNTLATTAIVADMDTLADIAGDITTVAGKASLITADFVADLNTVAVTDVINDINTLATSDIVSDLNTLATADIVSDLNALATSDIIADLNTLAVSDVISDINTLATSDIVSDLNLLATSDFVSDLNAMATSQNIANLSTVASDSADINTIADSINAGTFATKANSGANSDITSLTGITGGIDLNGSELILDSDADTSIHSSTDDQIDFKIGGTDKVVIDSNGNLRAKNGIVIEPSGGEPSLTLTAGTTGSSTINMGDTDDADAGEILYENTSNYMAFTTNGSEKVRIESDGDVGIGTSTPSARLHVDGGELTVTDNVNSIVNLTSGTSGNSIINMGDTSDVDEGKIQYTGATNAMSFHTNGSERITIESGGDVGIGITNPIRKLHVNGDGEFRNTASMGTALYVTGSTAGSSTLYLGNTTDVFEGWVSYNHPNTRLDFGAANSTRMTVDSTGYVGIGTTSPSANLHIDSTSGSSIKMDTNYGTDLKIATFYGNSTIRDDAKTNDAGINFRSGAVSPGGGSSFGVQDNVLDLGESSYRWDDVYATNGTIQTSDVNLKQQIAPLTNAEITAAKAISALFKTYKWNDSVAEKGDAARTHTGVVAQEVEAAMTAAGLDAGDYAFFISSTWWEADVDHPAIEAVEEVRDADGNITTHAVQGQEAATVLTTFDTVEEAPEGATERNRKGIRYPELLAFIGAATEQRLASIEARLTALEDV